MAVDDDCAVWQAIGRDLRRCYGAGYWVRLGGARADPLAALGRFG
jgi:hypothetical protein